VQALDRSVGLGSAGADEGVAGAELRERFAESLRAVLAAVMGEHALELPAAACRSAATRRASLEVCSPVGLPRGQLQSSAPAWEEWTSIAVSCQTAPFVPESLPTKKESIPPSSPGRSASTWRSGSRSRGGS
jgi:hypothetical protein